LLGKRKNVEPTPGNGEQLVEEDWLTWKNEDRRGYAPQLNIIYTEFAGSNDYGVGVSYYRGSLNLRGYGDNEFGCSLPYGYKEYKNRHFPPFNVRVFNPDDGWGIVVPIIDAGPHYTNDPYWESGTRPRAESVKQLNKAGIDLTPATVKWLELTRGKGKCHWEFTHAPVGDKMQISFSDDEGWKDYFV
jgi:hypothetical protein